jgi:hypothetical protein
MSEDFDAKLFAHCGINCRTCVGFFGYKLNGERQTPCGGCPTREKTCTFFKKHCENQANREKIEYCFECSDFPCEELKKIDKYYSQKYAVSIIENFTYIKSKGMEKFLKNEKEKWKCPVCGGVICVHTKRCYTCNP